MNKILIITPYYYPGYKSGGPQQTFMNIVEAYGEQYIFFVLTLNHDIGDRNVYKNIKSDWNIVGNAKVMYLPDSGFTIKKIKEISEDMDVILCGGLFEKTTIIALLAKAKKLIMCPFWVAPMGVFSKGAIKQKKIKKAFFLFYGKLFGLFSGVFWSFSSGKEYEDFLCYMGTPHVYRIATDIPKKPIHVMNEIKIKERLRIVFLARICYHKNLLYAIEVISKIRGNVEFHVWGNIENADYWEKCKKKFQKLPANIQWRYCGIADSDKVIEILSGYDVFILPTLGENFGHSIYEALVAGCIPVISDKTLWNSINTMEVGYVLALDDKEAYVECLNRLVNMDENKFSLMRKRAKNLAMRTYEKVINGEGYKDIFSGEIES